MTKAKKLQAALDCAAKARAADPLPDPAVERRFNAWSEALRAVVYDRLRTEDWHVDEWQPNPDCDNSMEFGFHYDARCVPLNYSRPMFVSTRMRLDASIDLEQELLRLEQEAKEFRQCAHMMYEYRVQLAAESAS